MLSIQNRHFVFCRSDLTSQLEKLQQSCKEQEEALANLKRREEELGSGLRKRTGDEEGDLDDTLVNQDGRVSPDARNGDEVRLEDLEPAGVIANKVGHVTADVQRRGKERQTNADLFANPVVSFRHHVLGGCRALR